MGPSTTSFCSVVCGILSRYVHEARMKRMKRSHSTTISSSRTGTLTSVGDERELLAMTLQFRSVEGEALPVHLFLQLNGIDFWCLFLTVSIGGEGCSVNQGYT